MGDIQKYEQAIRTVFNYSCLCSQHSPQSKSTSAGKLITFTVLSHRAVPHLSPHCTWGHIWEMLSTRAGKEKQVRRGETRAEGAAVSLKWRRGDVSPLLSADHWLNQEDFWHQQKSSGTSISSAWAQVEQEWGSWAELNEEPKEPGWKSQYPGGMGCWREKGAKWGQKWQGTRVLEAKNSKTRDQWEKHGIKKRSEVANIAERKEKQRKLLQWIWGEGTDSQPDKASLQFSNALYKIVDENNFPPAPDETNWNILYDKSYWSRVSTGTRTNGSEEAMNAFKVEARGAVLEQQGAEA